MSINDMKSFVQNNLKDLQTQLKAVAIHIGAAEAIQKEKGRCFVSRLNFYRSDDEIFSRSLVRNSSVC